MRPVSKTGLSDRENRRLQTTVKTISRISFEFPEGLPNFAFLFQPGLMKRSDDIRELNIELPKLTNGKNEFHFEVGKQFFMHFESPLVQEGRVSVTLELYKSLNQLDAHFRFQGDIELLCDRCMLPFAFPVDQEHRLIYAYRDAGLKESEIEDEVIYMEPKNHLLNISQEVYDFICLEVPIRKIPVGCDEECPNNPLNLLKEKGLLGEVSAEEESVDPRWEALKKLKSDN